MRFALTTAGLATVTLAGTAAGASVNFTHDIDRWAGEHSWQVHSSGGATIASQYISGSVIYAPGSLVSITSFVSYPSTSSHWGTVSGTIELAAGTYHVAMQDSYGDGWAWGSFVGGLAIGSGSGTVSASSASFSFTVVPAPGAMALLGLAGLAARRRRRA
jgi:MYXO-CTERM domain-containing protein